MKKKLGFIYNLVAYVCFPVAVKHFGVDISRPQIDQSSSSFGAGQWIKALRPEVALMAGFLTVVSFKICGALYAALWPAIVVTLICSATMVQNDWRDRTHDVKKGKLLASTQQVKFLLFNVSLWLLVALCLLLGSIFMGSKFVLLPALAIIVGLFHPNWRGVPILYPMVVAITSGAPSLLPWALGYSNGNMWIVFLLATLAIFCREQIKDLEDYRIDHGYKKTLPQVYGYRATITLLSILIVAISLLSATLSLYFVVTGALAFLSLYLVAKKGEYRTSKIALDVGLIYGLVILYLSGETGGLVP